MFNRKFLPVNVKIVFPKERSFKNEAQRDNEARLLSMLVYQLDYRVAVLN